MNQQTAEIDVLIRARYPIIVIRTWEENRIESELLALARQREKKFCSWSVSQGLHEYGAATGATRIDVSTREPLTALQRVLDSRDPTIYLFKDFHACLHDANVVRKVRDVAFELKRSLKTLILVSPAIEIPVELLKEIHVIDFDLPSLDELNKLLMDTIRDVNEKTNLNIEISETETERLLKAALGLTLNEAENVFAKILVRHGRFGVDEIGAILDEKRQIIEKSGTLEYFPTDVCFADVGGLSELKDWLRKRGAAFSEKARAFGLPAPKGILLIGVQGCGKSLCAKAVAGLWQLPLLRLDMGRLFSSLVGSSEQNVREAIHVAESISPAILWVDEIEKSFAGAASSSFSDSGTTSRVLSAFLTWLQEKEKPVFVIATANNVQSLPPELMRKGRLDEIFFVDLPGAANRREIFDIHIRKRGRSPDQFDLDSFAEAAEGFSGAEIEQCVISALFDAFDADSDLDADFIINAVKTMVPLSVTMKEKIRELRNWAQGRTRNADADMENDVRQI